jgi:hypothetical protein
VNPFEEDEESWSAEPDEFDPDSLGPDPPDATLSTDVDGSAADVPDGLVRAFWASVLFLNVALGALSIGAMLIYFRGDYATGVPALVIGLAAALAAARYYRDGTAGKYAEDASDDMMGATDTADATDGDGDTAGSNEEVGP